MMSHLIIYTSLKSYSTHPYHLIYPPRSARLKIVFVLLHTVPLKMHAGWKKKSSSEITIDPKANPYDCPSIVLWPSCRAEGINSSHQFSNFETRLKCLGL